MDVLRHAQAWRDVICQGIDPDMTAKVIADKGWLVRDGVHLTKKVSIPEVGRPRVYVFTGGILDE